MVWVLENLVITKRSHSFAMTSFSWCRWPESNRHGLFVRRILSPVRLPVPPHLHTGISVLRHRRLYYLYLYIVNTFLKFCIFLYDWYPFAISESSIWFTLFINVIKKLDITNFMLFMFSGMFFALHASLVSLKSFFRIGIIERVILISTTISSFLILNIFNGLNNTATVFAMPRYTYSFWIYNGNIAYNQ